MNGRALTATAASPGIAVGTASRLDAQVVAVPPAATGAHEAERARAALEDVAEQLTASAAGLRRRGRDDDADMVDASAVIAADPELAAAVDDAVRARGMTAAAAILEATESHAAVLAGLDDPYLAERADDVRSVGRRAARRLAGGDRPAVADGILVARDLGPADVAELDERVAGIALAAGGPTTHAAIVARSLGIPMVVQAGDELLAVADGQPVLVDGDRGRAILAPDAALVAEAVATMTAATAARGRAAAEAALPSRTADGHAVVVRVNAAGAPEVRAGLAAGAEGVGLLRTELAFLDAAAWPDEAAHRAALGPVLEQLAGRVATVRLLDFGGDKTPPFLRGTAHRGVGLLLAHPGALAAQLRALAATRGTADLRVLLPLAETPEQIGAVRTGLAAAGLDAAVGPMVETPAAAAAASALAQHGDFLSIGTNDLAHAVLRTDRFAGRGAAASDPRVLAPIRDTVAAAHAAGIPVEVCGEAASDPMAMPLLVGLGVDELSVGAARVATVRRWVRRLDRARMRALAARALACATEAEVRALVAGELDGALDEEAAR